MTPELIKAIKDAEKNLNKLYEQLSKNRDKIRDLLYTLEDLRDTADFASEDLEHARSHLESAIEQISTIV